MANILFKELSYKIIGILFTIHNEIGFGKQEKHYQRAIKEVLLENDIPFLEQVRIELMYENKSIGRYYIDFIIDHKIVLEIKNKKDLSFKATNQVLEYLRASNLDLGILACFTKNGVTHKRILRGYN